MALLPEGLHHLTSELSLIQRSGFLPHKQLQYSGSAGCVVLQQVRKVSLMYVQRSHISCSDLQQGLLMPKIAPFLCSSRIQFIIFPKGMGVIISLIFYFLLIYSTRSGPSTVGGLLQNFCIFAEASFYLSTAQPPGYSGVLFSRRPVIGTCFIFFDGL